MRTSQKISRSFKIVFFGGDFGTLIFKKILDKGYQIAGVVLNPKKKTTNFFQIMKLFIENMYNWLSLKFIRRNDQLRVAQTLILKEAIRNKIQVIQPCSITRSVLDFVRSLNPDLIVVAGYSKILPETLLTIPEKGCINVHPSLLPYYRGPAPVFWQILNGEKKSGTTVHFIDKGIDTGDIILQRTIDIDYTDTNGTLFIKLAQFSADVLIDALKSIEKGKISIKKQDANSGSFYPTYSKKDVKINWTKTAFQINNLIRASNPWPGAYSNVNGIEITIWESEPIERPNVARPGEIIHIEKNHFDVNTGKGVLRVKKCDIYGTFFSIRKTIRKAGLSVGIVLK